MNLKPLFNRVIVKAIREEVRGGIIVPETAGKEKPERGEVVATGPGKILDSGARSPVEVKVGDKVVFKKYSPDEVKVDGKEYLILEDSDIMAIIE